MDWQTDASFYAPTGIAIDAAGNFYVVDSSYDNIRKLSKVSGNGGQLISSLPTGLTVQVDGTTITTPFVASWTPGSTHTIRAPDSVPVSSGTQYGFWNWTAGTSTLNGATQTVTASSSSASYIAQFKAQYYLTTSAGTGGTVSPASGWNDAGSSVYVTGVPDIGYAFNGFSGALVGVPAARSLVMNGPLSVAASFAPVAASGGYAIATVPAIDFYSATPFVGLAANASGDLLAPNSNGSFVQKLAGGTGFVTTVAGGGYSYNGLGDGGPATQAWLRSPKGAAFGTGGDFFIADAGSQTVRKVTASTGIITTVAGGGSPPSGSIGDEGPAHRRGAEQSQWSGRRCRWQYFHRGHGQSTRPQGRGSDWSHHNRCGLGILRLRR